MSRQFVQNVLSRLDYKIITSIIPEGSRVLDLGCGDGELIAWLMEHKNVDARGVELMPELVQTAIARGASVYQGDIETSLRDYPDQAFDYVILSQTLQQSRHPLRVLRGMLRVGKRAIVAFPNFGHYSVRLAHLFSGRAPRNRLFPYEWYDSPNIHFLTVDDFEMLCAKENWPVERSIFLAGQREIHQFPNLMSEVAVFVITSR
ncbi:MAG: methionine biosynthesis protein MetW [Bryobacteraceae bacterium]|nr:methionine biosynthesis protein MetW [Bryobacteraceae bacterium]